MRVLLLWKKSRDLEVSNKSVHGVRPKDQQADNQLLGSGTNSPFQDTAASAGVKRQGSTGKPAEIGQVPWGVRDFLGVLKRA